ncbi:hypothetical protein GH714_041551 [Hevea brasiliensis]|uniref:RNase H type-1 domain-containing protein n=1 Tax=Hevea brasiliensis TaxID=3981 RepID=A0A6A6MRM6_HEVBR|nr:hypothetical protein GH714_041551 [Hevea brasiliensis]
MSVDNAALPLSTEETDQLHRSSKKVKLQNGLSEEVSIPVYDNSSTDNGTDQKSKKSFRDIVMHESRTGEFLDDNYVSEDDSDEKAMVWVCVPNLPVEFYSHTFLWRLGQKIGVPIRINDTTLGVSHGKFARMRVEVDLSKPLLSKFKFRHRICRIEYEGINLICFECDHVLGSESKQFTSTHKVLGTTNFHSSRVASSTDLVASISLSSRKSIIAAVVGSHQLVVGRAGVGIIEARKVSDGIEIFDLDGGMATAPPDGGFHDDEQLPNSSTDMGDGDVSNNGAIVCRQEGVAVWNIHGIGSRCSLHLLKDYKCKFKPLILVLVEPKISRNIADDISYDLGFDCWVHMESVGFSGGACDILITLLPKVEVSESISQFHLISPCNVSFKVITKALANRIKQVLPSLISPLQSSFIPGQHLHDNVVILQEIAHSMHHCLGQKGWMAIKNISEFSGIRVSEDIGSYLGVPMFHGRVVKASFDVLLSCLEEHLAGWKIKYLSLASHLTLIKSVLTALPNHVMQTILLLRAVCDAFDKRVRQFLWGNVGDHHHVPIVKWETITKPMDQGGLGVRTYRIMNDAFLMKLGWKLLSDDGALCCSILRNKYMIGLRGLNHMVSRTTSSNLWKGILHSVEALQSGSFRVVVSGMFTDFWNDDWVGIGPLFQNAQTMILDHLFSLSVSHFWDSNGWRWELIRLFLDEQICLMIEAVHLQSNVQSMDVYAWKATPNGCFSVKSAYRSIGGLRSATANSKWVLLWKVKVPRCIQFFMWKVEVDMDSLATIHLVLGSPAANAHYSFLLLQIHGLLKWSWQVALSHCYREANRVADVLANLEVTTTDHYQLLQIPLAIVTGLLHEDVQGVAMSRLVQSG